jgi:hypothetical protein
VNWPKYRAILHRVNDAARKRDDYHSAKDTPESSISLQDSPEPSRDFQNSPPVADFRATKRDETIRDDTKRDEKGTGRRFAPPTLPEVQVLISEKGYHFGAEEFHAFYESNGWMVGRNHMKSWQAACRTWEADPRRQKGTATKGSPAPGSPFLGLRRSKDGDGIMYQGAWYHPTPDLKRWYTEDGFRPDGTSKMADAKDASLNATIYVAMTLMVKQP